MKPPTLVEQGFRFVFRAGQFRWVHKYEILTTDIDCTDMNDDQFEQFVKEHTE